MIGIVWVLAASALVAINCKNSKIEEIIPFTLLSISIILYPFYCLNALHIGNIILKLSVFVLLALSIRQKSINRLRNQITPGLVAFIMAVLIVVYLTRNNYVALCDEMRLWGALPKALWYTQRLQLGNQSIIYPIMQSYPPGMALLVYFIESFNTSFNEWEIFLIYGLFVFSLMLPAFQDLKRGQWYLLLILVPFVLLIPCMATSSGGDWSYFYNSLFIDPIIGATFGFGLWFAISNSLLSTKGLAGIVIICNMLILLKHSGIMFAICIIGAGLYITISDDKEKNKLPKVLATIVLTLVVNNCWWSFLIKLNGASNPVGLSHTVTWNAIKKLGQYLLEEEVVNYTAPFGAISIRASFVIVILFVIVLSLTLTHFFHDMDEKASRCWIITTLIEVVVFLIGYSIAFGEELPCYQRYISTIVIGVFVYNAIRIISICSNEIDFSSLYLLGNKRPKTTIWGVVVYLFFMVFLCYTLLKWKTVAVSPYSTPIDVANTNSEYITNALYKWKLAQGQGTSYTDIYLLLPGESASRARLAHRMYMTLMESGVMVKNWYTDMNVVPYDNCENITDPEMEKYANQWLSKIIDGGYEYVYAMELDETTEKALQSINIILYDHGLYKVNQNSGFEKVNFE